MKAVVLLSGGLDSAVNLYWAAREYELTMAMFFDYGQRAASQELKAATWLCSQVRISLKEMKLPWLRRITHTGLVNTMESLSVIRADQLDDAVATAASAQKVWVPNRNGLFINMAASYADAYGIERIIVGFNAEEGASFPDNTLEFIERSNAALALSTQIHPKVESFTIAMNKTEIVRQGLKLGLDPQRTWSCYEGDMQACGICESCLRKIRAIEMAGRS